MEPKSAPNPIDSAGPLKRGLANLFYGWGYNFYRRENQLRADDLLIRGKLSELLGESRAHLRSLEAEFRRTHLPPPSREHPLADPAALEAAQGLQRAQRDLEALETAIRTAPVPEMDRSHQRHRLERDTLEKLLAADLALVTALLALRDSVLALGDGATAAAEASRIIASGEVRTIWERREQILSIVE